MAKINCWDYKKCGRHPGGMNEKELGICSAATSFSSNGKNGGKGAGRYCWKIAGTLCGGKVQGTFAEKLSNCSKCNFYHLVKREEALSFKA